MTAETESICSDTAMSSEAKFLKNLAKDDEKLPFLIETSNIIRSNPSLFKEITLNGIDVNVNSLCISTSDSDSEKLEFHLRGTYRDDEEIIIDETHNIETICTMDVHGDKIVLNTF